MNRLSLLAAATVAVGGLAFFGCDNRDTARNTSSSTSSNPPSRTDTVAQKTERAAEKTGDAIANAAEKTKDAAKEVGHDIADGARKAADKIGGDKGTAAAPDAEDIRETLKGVTDAALTKGGLNDLTERLVDADRNRIGKAIGEDSPEHTALVEQFRAAWKAKYSQDFGIKDKEKVFTNQLFTVAQSEIGAAAPSGTEVATGQKPGDLDANKEKGRNIATIDVQESHGLPRLSVPLIHELPDSWRIDVPDTIDAAKLRSNVLAHLKHALDMKDQWPADVNDAYAAVAHHVLEAVMDQPIK